MSAIGTTPKDQRAMDCALRAARAAVVAAFRDRKGHGGTAVVYRQITPDDMEAAIAAACLVAIGMDRQAGGRRVN